MAEPTSHHGDDRAWVRTRNPGAVPDGRRSAALPVICLSTSRRARVCDGGGQGEQGGGADCGAGRDRHGHGGERHRANTAKKSREYGWR